jgi:hypothetical protein
MNDQATTPKGTAVVIDVLANDKDTTGATICVVQSPTANGGTATVSDNKITYTPKAGFCGPDTFTYSLCKPDCEKSTATVTVTVTCPVCEVSGGDMTFKDNKATWTITNNGASPVTLSSLHLCWPAANKKLKKIRLNDKEIQPAEYATSPITITSGWRGSIADRTINPGTTARLTLEFEASKASTNQMDYCITAGFGPGCEVVFVPKPPVCDVTGGAMTFKDNKAFWEVTNNADQVTISSLHLCWPAANKKLKKIKLNGKEIQPGEYTTSPITITSGWRGSIADRTISAGTAAILTLEFEASKASTNQADYCITAGFDLGCEVVFVPGTSSQEFCDGTKPKILTMIYTGDGCEATHHSQDPSKVICSGDPNDATPVYIVATSTDVSKVYFSGIVDLDAPFDIDATNAGATRLDTNTLVKIYSVVDGGKGSLLQTVQFHTSCSQPLIYGDQYGSLELVGYTPG